MESVVNHCLSFCQLLIDLKLMMERHSRRAERHVIHDGGGAAAGSRHRPVIEIIHRTGDSHVQIHMSMHIHGSRQDITAFGIYDLSALL